MKTKTNATAFFKIKNTGKKIISSILAILFSFSAIAQIDSSKNKLTPPEFDSTTKNKVNKQKNDSNKKPNIIHGSKQERKKDSSEELKKKINKQSNLGSNSIYHQSTEDEMKSGILMKGGQMLWVENGRIIVINTQIVMGDGTLVQNDGTVTKPNGFKILLREGDYLDETGAFILVRNSNSNSK